MSENSEDNDSPMEKLRKADERLKATQAEIDRIIKGGMEKLSSILAATNIQDNSHTNNQSSITDRLKSLDEKGIAEYIPKCRNIIFMNGAGISTAAGIPDFRSPETGLYANLQKYNLERPELIFDLEYFKENPYPFYSLFKELISKEYEPTVAHYFQKLLVQKGIVRKIYTQNIDSLESIASIPDDKIVYAHGSPRIGHCLTCHQEYSFEWMKKTINEKEFLKCENEECLKSKEEEKLKIVKPDIIFFGEDMPVDFLNYQHDLNECDCLIVMGTSLKVRPFSMLTKAVKRDVPRLLINRDLVGDWQFYEQYPDHNYRDVSIIDTCDNGCLKFADLLGWRNDLEELIKNCKKRKTLSSANNTPSKN